MGTWERQKRIDVTFSRTTITKLFLTDPWKAALGEARRGTHSSGRLWRNPKRRLGSRPRLCPDPSSSLLPNPRRQARDRWPRCRQHPSQPPAGPAAPRIQKQPEVIRKLGAREGRDAVACIALHANATTLDVLGNSTLQLTDFGAHAPYNSYEASSRVQKMPRA